MATLMTPNATARALSTPKRVITPKAVRTMARAIIGRFDKTRHPEYQSHAYTAPEVAALRKAFAARAGRATAQPVRKPTVRKSSTATRKASQTAAKPDVAS
jgi:hypothetical protein